MATSIAAPVLHPALFILDVGPRKKESTLQLMVSRALQLNAVREAELLHDTLLLRERLGSTAVGKAVAVPHARSLCVIEPRVVLARSTRGIAWDAPDGEPVHLVCLVLSPPEMPLHAHIERVARNAAGLRAARYRARILEAERFETVAGLLQDLVS